MSHPIDLERGGGRKRRAPSVATLDKGKVCLSEGEDCMNKKRREHTICPGSPKHFFGVLRRTNPDVVENRQSKGYEFYCLTADVGIVLGEQPTEHGSLGPGHETTQ
jgi:hypothetical protein